MVSGNRINYSGDSSPRAVTINLPVANISVLNNKFEIKASIGVRVLMRTNSSKITITNNTLKGNGALLSIFSIMPEIKIIYLLRSPK